MGRPSETEVTASAIISFAEKLENDSLRFYMNLAERCRKDRDTFLAFAKEDEKDKVLVTRTYKETITDAIEACFSFKGLNLSDYLIETTLAEDASCADALRVAIVLEEKASKFYIDLADRSGSLLATIPRAFGKVAEVRSKRKLKLISLLDTLKQGHAGD